MFSRFVAIAGLIFSQNAFAGYSLGVLATGGSSTFTPRDTTDKEELPGARYLKTHFKFGVTQNGIALQGLVGQSRWADGGPVVPFKNPDLSDFSYGGMLSLGPTKYLQIHGIYEKSFLQVVSSRKMMRGVIEKGNKLEGSGYGVFLTGNQEVTLKAQTGKKLLLMMGMGYSQYKYAETAPASSPTNTGTPAIESLSLIVSIDFIGSLGSFDGYGFFE